MDSDLDLVPYCPNCGLSPPDVTLKRCIGCSNASYFSRDCQRANWSFHKKTCGEGGSAPSGSAPSDVQFSPPKGHYGPSAKRTCKEGRPASSGSAPADRAPFGSTPFDSSRFERAPADSAPADSSQFDSSRSESAQPDSALFDNLQFDNSELDSASCDIDAFDSAPAKPEPFPPKGLDGPITKPYTRLDNNTWLHDRPEKDVYRLLIDAYRMRVEDDSVREERTREDASVHDDRMCVDDESAHDDRVPENAPTHDSDADPDTLVGFRRFLAKAATQPGLLPSWWDAEKRAACEAMGTDHRPENFHDLARAARKGGVTSHYGDPEFDLQLALFAEAVYGRGPGGLSGVAVRKTKVAIEGGKQIPIWDLLSLPS